MYALMHLIPLRQLAAEALPAGAAAWIVAETWYKFHSFTLECAAFLATWYVIDLGWHRLRCISRRLTSTAVRPRWSGDR
jgi:hypothetical protein